MPQFDSSQFISQIFWFTIFFSIIFFFVSSFLQPTIRDINNRRKQKFNLDIEVANQNRDEAEKIKLECEKNLQNARKEAEKLLSQTYAKIQSDMVEKTINLESKIAFEKERAEKEILELGSKAHEQIEIAALDYASIIIEKLTNKKVENKNLKKYL